MHLRHPFARIIRRPEPVGGLIIIAILGAAAIVAAELKWSDERRRTEVAAVNRFFAANAATTR